MPRGPLTRAVPVIGSTVLPVFSSAIAIVRFARLPVNRALPSLSRSLRAAAGGFSRRLPTSRNAAMIPPFFGLAACRRSRSPRIATARARPHERQRHRALGTRREVKAPALTRTWLVSFLRRFGATAPLRACRHGRGPNVIASGPLVALRTSTEPAAPGVATRSTIAGDMERPPAPSAGASPRPANKARPAMAMASLLRARRSRGAR